jgi:sugar phosphate isomerase/epimerase
LARSVFVNALSRAEERNVTICIEPLAPTETNFINTAEEAVRFANQFNSSHFKVVLDVKAMCSEDKPIPQLIKATGRKLGYFHANDRNLKGPGFGDVDFKPIASALKRAGYKGFVSVEVFNFEDGPEVIAAKSIETLRKAFTNSTALNHANPA